MKFAANLVKNIHKKGIIPEYLFILNKKTKSSPSEPKKRNQEQHLSVRPSIHACVRM